MKRFAKALISIVLGGILLQVAFSHFGFRQTIVSIRQARPSFLVLGVALMVSDYLLRGARWRIWERSLSYWDSLRLVLIGFMGNNVLPARLSELRSCTAPC